MFYFEFHCSMLSTNKNYNEYILANYRRFILSDICIHIYLIPTLTMSQNGK